MDRCRADIRLPGQEQYVEWDAIQDEYFRRQTLPQTTPTQAEATTPEAAPTQEIAQKETPSSGAKETVDRLFDEAYEKGVVEDREFYDQYKRIKDHLRL